MNLETCKLNNFERVQIHTKYNMLPTKHIFGHFICLLLLTKRSNIMLDISIILFK